MFIKKNNFFKSLIISDFFVVYNKRNVKYNNCININSKLFISTINVHYLNKSLKQFIKLIRLYTQIKRSLITIIIENNLLKEILLKIIKPKIKDLNFGLALNLTNKKINAIKSMQIFINDISFNNNKIYDLFNNKCYLNIIVNLGIQNKSSYGVYQLNNKINSINKCIIFSLILKNI